MVELGCLSTSSHLSVAESPRGPSSLLWPERCPWNARVQVMGTADKSYRCPLEQAEGHDRGPVPTLVPLPLPGILVIIRDGPALAPALSQGKEGAHSSTERVLRGRWRLCDFSGAQSQGILFARG